MTEPGHAAGTCLPDGGPDGLLIALTMACTTVLLLSALLRITRKRDRQGVPARRGPRHAAAGPDLSTAVTIAEIQDRLRREALQTRRTGPPPRRKVEVLPRSPGSHPGRSAPRVHRAEADDTVPWG